MNDVAAELARRAKPAYLKDRAREAVKHRAVQVKDRTVKTAGNPITLGLLGGLATWAVARWIKQRRAQAEELHWEEAEGFYDTSPLPSEPAPEPGKTEELRERLSERMGTMRESMRDKMDTMKERASEKMGAMRERLPSRERMKEVVSEQNPLILGLGAVALGAALGFLLPVSRRERELITPYKEQMKDTVQAKVGELRERVENIPGEIEERIIGKKPGQNGGGQSTPPTGGNIPRA